LRQGPASTPLLSVIAVSNAFIVMAPQRRCLSLGCRAGGIKENAQQICRAAANEGLCMHGKSGACCAQIKGGLHLTGRS
jgi:hypothetical protein